MVPQHHCHEGSALALGLGRRVQLACAHRQAVCTASCEAIPAGTKRGFGFNYILFELENSQWRAFLSVTTKCVFTSCRSTNTFTWESVRIKSFVCKWGRISVSCVDLSCVWITDILFSREIPHRELSESSETTLKWDMIQAGCIIAVRCLGRLEWGQMNSLCLKEENFQYLQYYHEIVWFWSLSYKCTEQAICFTCSVCMISSWFQLL